jgi:pimeloyl-ACP methyl ester carboxylesterase
MVLRLPWLPEFLMRRRNFKALAGVLRESKRPEAFTSEDLDRYRQAWSQPGALTGMVNWYRALLRKRISLEAIGRVSVPTMVVWGRGEKYAERELALLSAGLCDHASMVDLDATHWLQHDEPERVNGLLLEFLKPS